MYDVIVVGGGPSGAIAALECQKRGARTLLLEKKKYPRDKACGGALSEKSMIFLNSINIELPKNIVENEYCGINVITPNIEPIKIVSNKRLGIIVKRNNFDSYLIENVIKNGTTVKECVFVNNIEMHDDNIKVHTLNGASYEAKYVIGADGAISTVARSMGLFSHINPRFVGLAMQADIPVDNVNDYVMADNVYTYLGFIKFGFGWIFPNKKSLNVGIGGQMMSLKNPIVKFKKFCNEINALSGLEIPKPNIHILPIGGIKRNIAKKRVFLVGDAAGFIDAMTGEGIYYAMLSGKYAAETICNKEVQNKASEYWALCYNNIWKNLRCSTLMALVTGIAPGLSSFQLKYPSINKHLIATTRGDEHYSKYYYRFFYDLLKMSPIYAFNRLSRIFRKI